MRVDKFLKVSRILKRRAVANEACAIGIVTVNNLAAKPSRRLSVGDIVSINFPSGKLTFKVLILNEKINSKFADTMYEVISEE